MTKPRKGDVVLFGKECFNCGAIKWQLGIYERYLRMGLYDFRIYEIKIKGKIKSVFVRDDYSILCRICKL